MNITHSLLVVTAVVFANLSVSSSAEEAKVPFAKGIRPEVAIGRPSKIKGGDFDDKMQVIEPRIKLTNTANSQAYIGYKGLFVLLGESAVQTGVAKVLDRYEFDITLPPKQAMETAATSVTTRYDTTGAKFGFKYDGWALQVTDSKGEVVLTKSTSSTLEKQPPDFIKTLKMDQCYTRQWKPCGEPRLNF